MKLSRLYSNDNKFHSITFNDGINVVIGKVNNKYDMSRDSHNLGKSSLIEVLDFMLLKELKSDAIFKKYIKYFSSSIFYLELLLDNDSYLTIRRSVAQPTKISFKKSVNSCLFDENTDWIIIGSFDKSKEWLNEMLNFSVLANTSYRSTISFFLRTQKDYLDVFQLSKNSKSKDVTWKPIVFELLGFSSDILKEKYSLDEKIKHAKESIATISSEMSINVDDYDRIRSSLDIKRSEQIEVQKQLDAFDFYTTDRSVNKELVEKIESQIASLNSREYTLAYDCEKIKSSLKNEPSFNMDQLKKIYSEANVYFPDNISHNYDELLQFNIRVVKERNKYLREQLNAVEDELKLTRKKLSELNSQRSRALELLQDKDTFHKFKQYQMQLVQIERDVNHLEMQLKNVDVASALNENIDKLKLSQSEVSKRLKNQVKELSATTITIKKNFNEIFKSVFNVTATLYVKPNRNGNIEFHADVAHGEDAELTAEGNGDSYRKIMCAAFDLAILSTYSEQSYFKFVYHDGILEGLDNRKKELYISLIRDYCNQYGLQYIFSTIEDDVPASILNQFTSDERCLELNDYDDSGKLFGFSF